MNAGIGGIGGITGLAGLCVAGALALACGSSRSYRPDPGPYDRIPGAFANELDFAREAFEEGDLEQCHARLVPLATAQPTLLPVRVFLQDVQLGLLGAGREVGGVRVPPREAQAHLADIYAQRADANPAPAEYVLAARLCAGGSQALAYLDQAGELDGQCVWVHYARAWWLFTLRRFPEAREAIARALDLDGGHMPTMRLHASMLASAGDTGDAVDVLRLWLARGQDDPLVDPRMYAGAEVDLAALLVLEDEAEEALSLLAGIRPELLAEPARTELVRAAALEDLGLRTLALSAARRANGLDREGLLPLVQQALLLQFEGNTTQERAIWDLIVKQAEARWEPAVGDESRGPLEAEDTALDFQAIMIQLQASARIERIDRERALRSPRP